jgi:hypothetical protein
MTNKKQKDYISMWFDVRKEQGINDDMSAGLLNTETRKVTWHSFRHRDMDGLGGLAKLLRDYGYPSRTLPVSSDKHKPSLIELFKLMFRAPKIEVPKSICWKNTYSNYKQLNPKNSNDAPIVSGFFSEPDTDLIKSQAKSHKVALGVYLFWALNKAVADNLLDGEQEYHWFYPVNLRGALDFGDDTRNYSSGINVHLSNNIPPVEIQKRIKTQLKSKSYWVLWWQANIGKLIGLSGVRWLYKVVSQRQFYAGSFSFLGSWPLKDAGNPPMNRDEVWITCGIGTQNYPVSTGIMLWHNQLTLGLKLHPYICNNISLTEQCMSNWKRNLLKGYGKDSKQGKSE